MKPRLRHNLALSGMTLAISAAFNVALVAALAWRRAHPPTLAVVLVLDFAAWLAHLAMHKSALLWRVHRVHHSDAAVDVTTSLRQHPGEGAVRFGFMAAFALGMGASPASLAVYRVWSLASALAEHADVRVPFDGWLALLFTSPILHKRHHARAHCDVNYGNIFSVWDRLFGTWVYPTEKVECGLDGVADPPTAVGLLTMPFRR